jgi:hypothetical protein
MEPIAAYLIRLLIVLAAALLVVDAVAVAAGWFRRTFRTRRRPSVVAADAGAA